MGNYSFRKDLEVAKVTEEEVGRLLEEAHSAKIKEYEDTYRYDVLLETEDGEQITVEIKEDFFCHKSGNVALEFKCRGKISGIQTSEADFYVYKIHGKNGVVIVQQPTSLLKEKIKNKKFHRIVNGGDKGSNSMNYLFKLEEFIKDATILQGIP